MSTLSSLLNVARDGLMAQTAALDVTGQNVANANTPGYSRLAVNLQTVQAGDTYGGSVVAQSSIRSADQFTFGAMLSEQGKGGAADARSGALAAIEPIVAPSAGGVSDTVNAFFTAMNTLAASPSDPSARSAALGAATSLAQSISTTAAGLGQAKTSLLTQAQGVATQVNGELLQIAQLNGQIVQGKALGNSTSSLEDQRDQLVGQVSTKIGAQVTEDATGSYTVFAAGTALVTGTSAASLAVGVDGGGNLKFTAQRPDGSSVDVTGSTNDGTLGGIREARDTDIAGAASRLDQFAFDLSSSINAVHSAGYALDGSTGHALFSAPGGVTGAARGMAVDPTIAGHPELLSAAGSASDVPGGNSVATALAQLASQSIGASGTPSASFGAIASAVGQAASAATSESALRAQTTAQATTLHQSATGVSLDQEMASLSQFQNAYAACSKVLQTADGLLSGLMQDL